MISNMLLSSPLCFLLCWMLPVDSMGVPLSSPLQSADRAVPLDMADKAVDDMYDGCNKTMTEKVKNTYFEKENTGIFADVWKSATDCANAKVDQRDPEDEALTKDHMQAICVYTTSDDKTFYKKFNDHVRNNRSIYGTSFQFHSLHFWLTSAVQILNKKNKKCVTTYRRTNVDFTGEVNQKMRFGHFASSSKNSNLSNFGKKTCFKITTCKGGFLNDYSAVGSYQQEVLIPPYEMFQITDKKKGPDVEELSDCEVVYFLQNAGVKSYLNCKAGASSVAAFSMSLMMMLSFVGVSLNI